MAIVEFRRCVLSGPKSFMKGYSWMGVMTLFELAGVGAIRHNIMVSMNNMYGAED